jgi:hypothetical protein
MSINVEPKKDMPWGLLVVIVVACAIVLSWVFERDTSSSEINQYEPSACIYLKNAYADGNVNSSERQFYETNCM